MGISLAMRSIETDEVIGTVDAELVDWYVDEYGEAHNVYQTCEDVPNPHRADAERNGAVLVHRGTYLDMGEGGEVMPCWCIEDDDTGMNFHYTTDANETPDPSDAQLVCWG